MLRLLLSVLLLCATMLSAQNSDIARRGNKFVYKGEKRLFHTRYDSIRNFSESRAAVCKDGKWGYIDEQGILVTPLRFAAAMDVHNGIAGVKLTMRDGWFAITKHGRILHPANLDTIIYLDSFALGVIRTFFERKDTVYHVYHYDNQINHYEEVYRITRYDSLYLFSFRDHILRSSNRPRSQIVDRHGVQKTIPFVPDDSIFKKDIVITTITGRYQQLITVDGRISRQFDKVGNDTNGFRDVSVWKYHGVMNAQLEIIIPLTHDKITHSHASFLVSDTNRVAWYDTSGKCITPGFHVLNLLGNGMACAKNNNEPACTLFNYQGEIISKEYGEVFRFHSGVARVLSKDTTRFAYIDTSGMLMSEWYPCAIDFHEVSGVSDYETYRKSFHGGTYSGGGSSGGDIGFSILRVFLGIATVGMSEIFLSPPAGSASPSDFDRGPMSKEEFDKCYKGYYSFFYGSDFSDGYAIYTEERKTRIPNLYNERNVYYGLMDSTGKKITKAEFLSIVPIDTFFVIEKSTGKGLMTRSGKIILTPKYHHITLVRESCFRVEYEMQWFNSALFYYDGRAGKFLSAFAYSDMKDGGDSTILLQHYADWGYMDLSGKWVVAPKYEYAAPFENGKARVKVHRNDAELVIDRNGKVVH